jgi:hypothetical protein
MANKKSVIIFVTAGLWQLNGIKIAIKEGYDVLSIDEDSNAVGFKISKYKINISLLQKNKIFKILKKLNLKYAGVLSYCSEAGMELCSEISERYKLNAPSLKTTRILTNKDKQRNLFSRNNILQPYFKIFDDKEKLINFLKKNNDSLIVKPIDSSGSRGVFKYYKNIKNLKQHINNSFYWSKLKKVIIEKYIYGIELTVETFFQNGKMNITAITSKKKIKKTNGTVAYELSTYKLSNYNYLKLKSIIYTSYKCSGFRNGVGHAEIIKSDNSFYIIEIAGRGPGFDVFDKFIPLLTGINMPKFLIKNSTKQKVTLNIKEHNQGLIRYFPSKKGKIKNIRGFEELQKYKKVYGKKIAKIGDLTDNAITDGDRLGYIISIDALKKNAINNLKLILKTIKFEYE